MERRDPRELSEKNLPFPISPTQENTVKAEAAETNISLSPLPRAHLKESVGGEGSGNNIFQFNGAINSTSILFISEFLLFNFHFCTCLKMTLRLYID